MRRQLIVTILLSAFFSAAAQQQPLFNHQQWYKTEDGLPQSFITGIVQDQQGFIWAGTLDGVVRFDGKVFKVYRSDPNDSFSLSSNITSSLSADRPGKIFVRSPEAGTLNELDPVTGRFRHFRNAYSALGPGFHVGHYKDSWWTYLRADLHQVGWLDVVHHEKIPFISGVPDSGKEIFWGWPLPVGQQWLIASQTAIYELDSNRRLLNRYLFTQPVGPLPVKRVPNQTGLFQLSNDLVAIPATNRLYLWHLGTHVLEMLPLPDTAGINLPRHLQLGRDGHLYFVAADKVYRMEANRSFTLIWQNTLRPGRIITAMLIDQTGVMWAGLDAAGLVRVDLASMPFASFTSDLEFQEAILRMLLLPEHNLEELTHENGSAYLFRSAWDKDGDGYIFAYRTQKPNLNPVYVYEHGKVTALAMPSLPPGAFTVTGLAASPGGSIWAFDQAKNRLIHWADKRQVANIIQLPPDSFPQFKTMGFGGDMVAYINDDVWLSTNGNGLYHITNGEVRQWFNPQKNRAGLPSNLTDICKDPLDSNIIWIGSMGGGLYRFDRRAGMATNITTKQGLPNNTVYCIEPDAAGNLWLSTNKGIARLDPKTGAIHHFVKNDGLPGDEFNRAHTFRFRDGRIVFGGTDGYVVFNPMDFRLPLHTTNAHVHLTGIEVNGIDQVWGTPGSLIDSPMAALRSLQLPYNRNFVSVSFVSLVFNDPQEIRYRYRLLGVETAWNESGNNNMARYTQLRPGRYTLQISATGLDGQYGNEIKELSITVRPPFWNTWWAWVVYTCLVALVAALWYRYYQKRRAEQALQMAATREVDRLQELDQLKEQFFSNITHELRTPLTLISAPLEQLGNQPGLNSETYELVTTAQNNSERLLRLINQMLDVNKLEAGHLKLETTAGEPALFFAACVEKFMARAAGKNINFSSDFSKVSGHYFFDPEKWETIIYNLLSNAMKFTPAGGSVAIIASIAAADPVKDLLSLEVSDTGIGIAEKEQAHIFNRYFQAGNQQAQYHGTGIGLALVKELVQLMQGTITVTSNVNKGTRFTLNIPLDKANPSADQPIPKLHTVALQQAGGSAGPVLAPSQSSNTQNLLLLVEDNDELRSYMSHTLGEKYTVITATNGAEGREQALAAMPDLIVSDRMMPVMDGTEFCRLCKNDIRTAHIPFVLLTSRASQDAKLEGLGSGADDYLTKPFNITELHLRLGNLLEQQGRLRRYWEDQMLKQTPAIPTPGDIFVQELYSFIEERLDDTGLDVETIATQMGLSQSSLNRKLKTLTGTSANDFVRTYRLKKAAAFLAAGHDVSQTAYMTGFSSPAYFSKRFKEFFGQTPSDYLS